MTIENASIEKLLQNQGFVKELIIAKTDKDIKELFAKNGVDLQDQQLHELKVEFSKVYQDLKKLDRQQLNQIAGGKFKERAAKDIKNFGVVGGYVGSLVGSTVGIYKGLKKDSKDSSTQAYGKYSDLVSLIKNTVAGTIIGASAGASLGAIVGFGDELRDGVEFLIN